MSTRIELPVGRDRWPLTVRPEALVRPVPEPAAGGDPRELVRLALEAPLGLAAPLRRALTPDDRVAVVIDPRVPHLGAMVAALLEHLASAGIAASGVTLVAPPGSSDAWLEELPDEYGDVTLETHDPADRKKLAYVASTKAGRRVYLNRSLAEADAMVVLTGRGFDPVLGHAGAEAAIFPALSDAETRAAIPGRFHAGAPSGKPTPAQAEANEVVWLLGTPVFVQVVPGAGDDIADVVATLPDRADEGLKRHDARWRVAIDERPDLVVAAVSGDPEKTTFAALAAAAACGARAVKPGGRVAVLSTAAPPLPEAAEILRRAADPADAAKALGKQPPADAAAAFLWAFAAKSGSLFVATGWPADQTEELFATPLAGPAEVQRLVNAADRVLIVPDADKTMIDVT